MALYARIDNGLVAELFSTTGNISALFHPDLVWVDVTKASPQPLAGWTAVKPSGTWVFAAPVVPALTLPQQAQDALAAGFSVVSTGTPALSGIYSCDAIAQARITAIQTRINAGLGLPLSASAVDWIDIAGVVHAFTADEFTAFAHALSDYVYQLDMIALGAGSALPAQPVTIA